MRPGLQSQATWQYTPSRSGLFSTVAPNSAVESALHREDTLGSISQLARNPSRAQALFSQASLAEASFLSARPLQSQASQVQQLMEVALLCMSVQG